MILRLVFLLSILPMIVFSQADKDILSIKKVMADQEVAWNSADIPAFMEGYWKSEKLKFVSPNRITRGWQATLEGYQKGYPDQAAMGKLTFTIREVEKVTKKVATVVGKFRLDRENDVLSGSFFLVWRKIKGEWLIISDFTVSD
ncbi:MAG: nuclear transport factor 2 family protein [Bacteroidota bacterium]